MGSGRRDGRGSVFTVQWQPTGRLRPQISWSLGGPLRVVGVGGAIGTVQAGRGGGGSSFAAPRADTPPNTNNRRPPQLRSTSSIDTTITRETLGQARLRQWPSAMTVHLVHHGLSIIATCSGGEASGSAQHTSHYCVFQPKGARLYEATAAPNLKWVGKVQQSDALTPAAVYRSSTADAPG
jgi:hypothetical protein